MNELAYPMATDSFATLKVFILLETIFEIIFAELPFHDVQKNLQAIILFKIIKGDPSITYSWMGSFPGRESATAIPLLVLARSVISLHRSPFYLPSGKVLGIVKFGRIQIHLHDRIKYTCNKSPRDEQ